MAPTLAAVRTALPAGHAGPETLVGKMLRASSWITANSKCMLAQVRTAVPEIAWKSSVVYNGLGTPDVEPTSLCFERPVIACVARLVEKKGVDVAVRALAMVRKRIAEASLLIAGDGPERGALEGLAAELGLKRAVSFLGWTAPALVPALMNRACVVVVPSRRLEPFGNVAVEAMMMARPVIVTDQGGLPEVVVHGETGFVVAADDPAALAEAAVRLLGNPSLARRLGQAGRERALQLFSLDRYAQEYEVLYRQIVDRAKRAGSSC
jgi:glycosyltransferase involved in cell wall biosynthesis